MLDKDDVDKILDIARRSGYLQNSRVKDEVILNYIREVGINKLISHPELRGMVSYILSVDGMEEVLKGLVDGHGVCRIEINLITQLYGVIADIDESCKQKLAYGLVTIKNFSSQDEFKARYATILNLLSNGRYVLSNNQHNYIEK